jgi:hypothetical protein
MVGTSDVFDKIAKLFTQSCKNFVLVLDRFCPMY